MIIKGWTDEVTTCTHCGKPNLKRTCAVETDGGEVVYYGSVCIGHVYGRKAGKDMVNRADYVTRIKQAKDRAAFALRAFGWGTNRAGDWIVDGFNRPVIEVRG